MSFCQAFFVEQQTKKPGAGQDDGNAIEQLYESIRFNLQSLLRTEAPMVELDDRLSQIQNSNWRYGVVDIQSNNRFMDAERFAKQLAASIGFCEPRLSQIKVLVVEHPNEQKSVHFQLCANIDPALIKQYSKTHQRNTFTALIDEEATSIALDIDMNSLSIEEANHDNFV